MSDLQIINQSILQNPPQFTFEELKDLLKQLSNSNNTIRNKAEEVLTSFSKEILLYQYLFHIFKSETEEKYYRVQSILLVKNLLRMELNSQLNKSKNENEQSINQLNTIVDYIKSEIVQLIQLGKFGDNFKSVLTEVIMLITDKKFPSQWPEIISIFSKIFDSQVEDVLQNEESLVFVINLTKLFYLILKQNNKKRTLMTRTKFFQYKQTFLDMFFPFYERIQEFFNLNMDKFENIKIVISYLSLLKHNDQILLILIDSFFNVNEFHKDEKLMILVKIIIDKTFNLLNQIYNNPIDDIKNYLHVNLYKILKNLSKIQSSHSILFYKDLDKLVQILLFIIFNCNLFRHEILKVDFFFLAKILNTVVYKELLPLEFSMSKDRRSSVSSFSAIQTNLSSEKTPEKQPKKIKSAVNILVSPSKFKNYEAELQIVNETFALCFKEEVVRNVLEHLIKKVPFIFKKEIENLEVELLAEIEEDLIPSDMFSTNIMSWQLLYKNLLESLISNFPGVCVNYMKETLEVLYQNVNNLEFEMGNILLIDSIIFFVNLLPNLYKQGIISETEMIDYNKFLSYIETIVNKSEIIMKKYIVTISKWSEVLISNDALFNYMGNILIFLNGSRNNIILIECLLALKNIISVIDRYSKNNFHQLTLIDLSVDSNKLQEKVKNQIDWGNILTTVSNVCFNLMTNLKSAELLLALVNLLTSLIHKCHYQCDGKIVEIIRNSKFSEILQNDNEFALSAFIEMWKSLVLSFPSSTIIADLALQYISITFKKEINFHNLGLLQFSVRVLEQTDEIRSLLINFLKENIIVFKTTSKQYLSNILFGVLEELILFDIFDENDIKNIISLCEEKYIPLHVLTIELMTRVINDKINNYENSYSKNNDDIIYSDLSEYKTSIISVVSTGFYFFWNFKNFNIINQIRRILTAAMEEIYISSLAPSSFFSTTFLSGLVSIVNRVAIFDFELFKEILNGYLSEKKIDFCRFFTIWVNRMEQIILIELRKLNILTLCKFLPFLDKDTFLNNLNDILHISVITVHSELTKKIIKNEITLYPPLISNQSNSRIVKSLNVRQSVRKRNLIEQDNLMKLDIHSLFVDSFNAALVNNGISYEELVNNLLFNYSHIKKLNEILGVSPVEKY